MADFFRDWNDGQQALVKVDRNGKGTTFTLTGVFDIFAALHYLEAHPESRGETSVVRSDRPLVVKRADSVETYSSGTSEFTYSRYNFVLLNPEEPHEVGTVVQEFSDFLSYGELTARRKVKILDTQPWRFRGLSRGARDRNNCGTYRSVSYSPDREINGQPAALYLWTAKRSKGLQRGIGLNFKRSPHAKLEERLVLR